MPKQTNTNGQIKALEGSAPSADILAAQTPTSSPVLESVEPTVTLSIKDFTHALIEAFKSHGLKTPVSTEPRSVEPAKSKKEIHRASKLTFQTVDEVWDTTSSNYKIVSSIPTSEPDKLDENVFIARRRIEKNTEKVTSFVDIKSEGLRDVLRVVLEGVHGISLREDMPTIEQKLLYHYVSELDARAGTANNVVVQKQLCLLTNHLKKSFALEITFDLLWVLFKPDSIVYGKCYGTEKPRGIIFDSGMVKKLDCGTEYFHIQGRYLDFNGKDFGEASTVLGITKFSGAKRIDSLEALPLQYHPRKEAIRHELIGCGRKFQALMGSHHREHSGTAFLHGKTGITRASIRGRIVVDASFFYEMNPDYTKPRFDKSKQSSSFGLWGQLEEPDKIAKPLPKPADLSDELLLVCSPTVLGFSLSINKWLEFAVSDIHNIDWNPESFDRLTIPDERKELIRAVVTSHVNRETCSFDDFVRGKGQGLVVLLHGSPGVGKTLTAEGLSEYLKIPLLAISSGELSVNAKEAETQLSRIFRQAEKWKALLLFDEADVFLRQRSLDHVRDAHIIMFLRTLEYYRGILFLTTNRVRDFDGAMQSRIDLPLKYPDLSKDTRKTIWTDFLKRNDTFTVDERDVESLAEKNFNGRQIKNAVKVANEWAAAGTFQPTYSHLRSVLKMYADFQCDMVGHGSIENLSSYT